jgi:hypothetical protein
MMKTTTFTTIGLYALLTVGGCDYVHDMPATNKSAKNDELDLRMYSISDAGMLALLNCKDCLSKDGATFAVQMGPHCDQFDCEGDSSDPRSFTKFQNDHVITGVLRTCTAAFIGPGNDTVITAAHCLAATHERNLERTFFIMDAGLQGATAWPVQNGKLEIEPKYILRYVETLHCEHVPSELPDWAVVRVAPLIRGSGIQDHPTFTLASEPKRDLRTVLVLAHPRGLPLKLSIGEMQEWMPDGDSFLARFDVSVGSSGAPIIDPLSSEILGINAGDTQLVGVSGRTTYEEEQCAPPGPDRKGCKLQPASAGTRIAAIRAGKPSDYVCTAKTPYSRSDQKNDHPVESHILR